MRNLKRVLGLALASVMVLSMMVVGAGAANYDDFTDKDEIVNTEAVQMLVELGVLQGKDTGAFDPTGIITRGEMAKIICVVLNKGQDPNLGTVASYSYTDTVGHWAAGYIEYCTQLGIVAGKGDGTFAPNDTVTATEASKMLLVALGYSAQFEGMTGANWAVATNVLANKNGLYDGLAINVDAGLTRDNAAQMMYNALDADTVLYDYDIIPSGDSVSAIATAKETGVTLLTEKFGVTKVEAIVVANEYATLSGDADNALDAGETKIEIVSEDDGGNGLGVRGTYEVSTSVDMLGKQVTMFIKYKNANSLSDKDAVVYGSPIVSSKNNIVTATDGSYVENNGTTKGLLSKNDLALAKDVVVLKNYEELTVDSTVNAALSQKQGGALTLIDNDNDDEVEYVIYNEYTAGVVTNYSTSGDGSIKITGIDKYDDAADVVGFDDVAKGDFVLAIEYGGKLYVEVPETVTGELGSFSTSKATLKVDDTTYDISDIVPSVNGADKETYAIYEYLNEENILGTTATYYFDNNGYVVAVCDADETYGNYAVILAFQGYKSDDDATFGDALGKDARVKVLLSDGTIDTYDVYSIDGEKPGDDNYSEAGINQYDVFSYALTDDGDIKLGTERGPVTDTTDGMRYTKGSSTLSLNGDKYAVTSSTVFLYYDGSDVTRFVGKTSPDIGAFDASTSVAVAVSSNNPKEAAVVFVNDTATAQYDGNYLYVYKEKVTKNSDGYEADVILADGTIETITIDTDSYNKFDTASMKIAAGMYAYSVSDDVYSLSNTGDPASFIKAGVILASRSDYITLDESYTLTSDTIVAYGETNEDASVGEALNTGDSVVIVINEDDEVEFAVITRYAADNIVDGSKDDIEDALDAAGKDGVVEVSGELPAAITVPADRTLVLTGNVEGTAAIDGAGTVELKNATIAGDVTVTDTTLDGAAAVASGAALTIDVGTTVNGDAAITVADGGAVTVENGTTLKPGASITVEDGASLTVSIAGQDVNLTEVISGDFTIAMNDNKVAGEEDVYGFTVTINGKAEIVSGKTLQFWADNDELVLGADAKLTVSGTLTAEGDVTAAKGATIIVAEGGNITGVDGISDAGTYTYDGKAWTAAE